MATAYVAAGRFNNAAAPSWSRGGFGSAQVGPCGWPPNSLDSRRRAAHYFDNTRIVVVTMKAPDAVAALAALAHESRLAVFRMLVEAGPEGLPAGTIATRLKVPPSSLTFHLQNLTRAGLITQQRLSRQLIYSTDFSAMNALVDYLTENCCAESESAGACCPPVTKPTTARKLRRTA